MKTKFTKVAVSERMPESSGFYFCLGGTGQKQIGYFNGQKFVETFIDVRFWFEESPDREEEMIGMLEKVYPLLFERHLYNTADDIKKLLQSLKQEK